MMRLGNENLNSDSRSKHEEERLVARVMMHPYYKSNHVYFDVGLAVADRRIEFRWTNFETRYNFSLTYGTYSIKHN